MGVAEHSTRATPELMSFEVHFSKCRDGFYMAHHIYDTNIEHVVLERRFIIGPNV